MAASSRSARAVNPAGTIPGRREYRLTASPISSGIRRSQQELGGYLSQYSPDSTDPRRDMPTWQVSQSHQEDDCMKKDAGKGQDVATRETQEWQQREAEYAASALLQTVQE